MPQSQFSATVVIANPDGLHARPAEVFARLASSFKSHIEIVKEGRAVDGKSILQVLTLGAPKGTKLQLNASGADAEDAIAALTDLVNSNFAADKTNKETTQDE